jgi:nicotinamidase-related amidase
MKILIVVDMLNDFLDPEGALYCGNKARKILPFVKERIAHYRAAEDGAIIYVNDSHAANDKEFQRFPPHAITGTWGADVVPGCMPVYPDKVFEKTRYSGFFGTPLEAFLAAAREWSLTGIESVEVVGVCTSICVMDTVGGLANRDVENIIVPAAGVADFDPEMHKMALRRICAIYGAKIVE